METLSTILGFVLLAVVAVVLVACQSSGRPFEPDVFVQGQPNLILANQDVDIPVLGGNAASHPYLIFWDGRSTWCAITEVFGPAQIDQNTEGRVRGHVWLRRVWLNAEWETIARTTKDGRIRRHWVGPQGAEAWEAWVGSGAIQDYPYADEYVVTGRNSNTYMKFIGEFLKARGFTFDWDLGHSAYGADPEPEDVAKLVQKYPK